MLNRIRIFLVFTVITSSVNAADEKELMTRITVNCSDIRNKIRCESVGCHFNSYIVEDWFRWSKENKKELLSISPQALSSSKTIYGEPFSEIYQTCEQDLKKLEQLFNQWKVRKKAEDLYQDAFFECKAGIQLFSYQREKEINQRVAVYKAKISKAEQLDASLFREKAAYCNANFLKKAEHILLSLQQEKAERAIKKQADEEAEQLRQEKAWNTKVAYAKERGFISVYVGLTSLIDDISNSFTTVDEAKSYLIEVTYADRFEVSGLLDDFVIYSYPRNGSDYLQVALLRDRDAFYSEKSQLRNGYYKVIEVREFKTVLGVRKQLLVLAPLK